MTSAMAATAVSSMDLPSTFSELFPLRRPNEARFMAAAIDLVAERGVERVSVGDVIEVTKLSRPTFYSYFEGIRGIYAAIWLDLGPEWLESLLTGDIANESDSPTKQRKDRALLEILAISHRASEIQEITHPIVVRWWDSVARHGGFHAEKSLWLTVLRIGIALTQPIDAKVKQARAFELAILSMHANPRSAITEPPAGLSSGAPAIDLSSSSDLGVLLQATMEVVSRAGVPAATMARIARRAKVSTGSLYPKFDNLEHLVATTFGAAIERVARQNFESHQSDEFSVNDIVAMVVGGFSPGRKTWRNFRVELTLEARRDPELAKLLATELRKNNELLKGLLQKWPYEQLVNGPIPYAAQAVGLGLTVLQNAGVAVTDVNHFHFFRELSETVRQSDRD